VITVAPAGERSAVTAKEIGADIVALVNCHVSSPCKDELEAIIARCAELSRSMIPGNADVEAQLR
jgi:hypothetical protein